MNYILDIVLPRLLTGLEVTLKLLAVIIPLCLLVGIVIGVGRVFGPRAISHLLGGYVFLCRGIPLIVWLLILFFVITRFGIYVSSFWAAAIGFILVGSAYESEYVRGAIRSIGEDQFIAAQSLGMSKFQCVGHIILPQALRIALPGLTNDLTYTIRDTSMSYVVGLMEIFGIAKSLNALSGRAIEIFLTAAFFYQIVVAILTIISKIVEKKIEIPIER